MNLTAGEIIDIITKGAPGGWCTGVRGAFPTDYVEILNGSYQTAPSAVLPPSAISFNTSLLGLNPGPNSLGTLGPNSLGISGPNSLGTLGPNSLGTFDRSQQQ